MEATQFIIGAEADCADSECGKVTKVVIDPLARVLTHLVVEPKHRSGLGRLVPLALVDSAGDTVKLKCTLAEFEMLDRAEETQFLPGSPGSYGQYQSGEAVEWPYYRLGGLGSAPAGFGGVGLGIGNISTPVVYDTIPDGDVEIRRGEPVIATDGDIGQVQGLIIDTDNRKVTHVLLQEGHIWGRKEVAIPIGTVISAEQGIRIDLSRDQVGELPSVPVSR
jgi:sporulation protein YlmC with PRC-barrel domain